MGRRLSPDELGSRLRARFGDDVGVADAFGHAVATVPVERYHDAVRYCRDEPEFGCDFCEFTGGVDLGAEDGFEVVTQLFSTTNHHSVRIKVRLPYEGPSVPTISDLFPTADWHERELMEMFGIAVEGHPRPVKLLLSEPFEGHPLRKDFALMSREAKPWPGAVEGE
ncbi:MAG TPA: NADH-quinone oxidoreductase subunit C, partial [Actinomycetota bacterium]|nr:NADH-quinone oxidoreductase subunit C [Actinomycetota bacterium]